LEFDFVHVCVFICECLRTKSPDIKDADATRKYIKYLDFRVENGTMPGNGSEIGDQLVNQSYYNGIDIRLAFRKSNPYDVYSNVYRRPYMGVGFYTSTFQNANVGRPIALYFFLNFAVFLQLPACH